MRDSTWIEKKDLDKVMAKLDRNYQWYGKPAADKTHKTGRASAGQLIAVKRSENLEIPDWFKELRVTVQEGLDHLPVRCKVEWKERTKNSSREGQKIQERMKWNERKSEKYVEAWRGAWFGRREEEQENREEVDNEG